MTSSSNELLSAEGAVLKDPGQVERALSEMWKEVGEAASGEAHQAAATRVCVANLVVVAAQEQWNDLIEVLGELSPMYPTRTIALLMSHDGAAGSVGPASSRSDRQDAGATHAGPTGPQSECVRASVSALCHVPQPGQPQVCCEQILLRATHAQSGDLHRSILPMLEADVPVMVWWMLAPGSCRDLLDKMARLSRRFILDAGLAGVPLLLSLPYPQVREIGWYRIHRWRELIASMFDGCGVAPLEQIDEVRVEIGAAQSEVLDAAIWIIAFLGGQLGWQLSELASHTPVSMSSREASWAARGTGSTESGSDAENSSVLAEFHFTTQRSSLKATIQLVPGEGLVGLTIHSGKNAFEARRGADELRIMVHEEHVCQVPRVVHLPRRRRSEALATSLAGRAVDPAFTRAAPLAAAMASMIQDMLKARKA